MFPVWFVLFYLSCWAASPTLAPPPTAAGINVLPQWAGNRASLDRTRGRLSELGLNIQRWFVYLCYHSTLCRVREYPRIMSFINFPILMSNVECQRREFRGAECMNAMVRGLRAYESYLTRSKMLLDDAPGNAGAAAIGSAVTVVLSALNSLIEELPVDNKIGGVESNDKIVRALAEQSPGDVILSAFRLLEYLQMFLRDGRRAIAMM
ncbi:JM21 [macacine gammaherpesvirus 11]|uniref:JM21 n=2 Tax=macacine gammaherpesvirus 11 TaxID=2560570 RepID=G9JM29_9GAMA|nr:JM21 [Macaca fuscata rhadinovirus]AAS99998.1 JM21 [Macaca fuscata rhadinovirus]AEW87546.1 JM21 [Macaca fuscata rhadinovirus]AEW87716.1 JM21 [Macaca fuscata rhadinovirus]